MKLSNTISSAILLLCLLANAAFSQVKLPRLISDGMVLQRDTPLKIRGWANPGEEVEVTFNSQKAKTTTAQNGEWTITLSPMKAGGPFTMDIKASNQITLKNILLGDVWICSGQSNMELTMERVKDKYPHEISNSENPNIRQFLVPDQYDFNKQHNDLEGGAWESASTKTIYSFSAVAYFFALDLYKKYNVPVGLINAALGGSPVEAWMGEEALKAYPTIYEEAQRFKNDELIKEIERSDKKRNDDWYADLNQKDEGLKSPKWSSPELEDADWKEMNVPGYWADESVGNINGAVWFRKKINITKSMTGKPGKLWLGRIVDADSAFINGQYVGHITYQYPPRKYNFDAGVLKEGENTIVVRVINSGGKGGFVPDKPYFLAVENDTINLEGTWQSKLGAAMPPLQGGTAIRFKPTGLYNKMVSPLFNTAIKGVIWYQGESNAGRPTEYKTLFPDLITNWKTSWAIGDFPFLFVQLANFMEPSTTPTESSWAELREAQRLTLSNVKNTGMAVTIDIGEWNDIHPLNKEDVGNRLALAAQHIAYGDKKVVYSGPTYQSMKIKANKIELTFSNVGSGLISKNGTLQYFAIAGSDKQFRWANATIKRNKVIVWSDEIKNPVAVRYAWADNPEGANLYNKEGLPASPFTTESK